MAHLSLYRAFRPDTFDKMVRQEHVVRILKNQIEGNAVGHAYLFCGPRGTGKTSVARIFARAVNCEHPQNGSPCGTCAVCRALAEGGNLDVTEIDAASNNGVNEMRDLREKVQYPPVSGTYKVYIIDEVHMLTDSAFNALLKTLEEPPRHAIFILATTEPQKIPATILSRCMRLDFKLIPQADLEAHLKKILKEIGKPYEDEAVSAIARAGAGSDRDMLSIAEMCLAYGDTLTYEGVTAVLGSADIKQTNALCKAILTSDCNAALSLTEEILAEGKSVGVLLRDLLLSLNRVAIVKTCANAERILCLPKEIYEAIANLAEVADGHAILRATEIFAKTESELRFASSSRICLETAILKAAMPSADYNIDALIARISALEKKLADGANIPQTAFPELKNEQPQPAEEPKPDSQEFPTEEPVFSEAYFADEPYAPPAEEKAAPPKPVGNVAETGASAAGNSDMTAETAFGKFMRTLRKMCRNGVLFTMCSDLEAVFEGATLVLYTESETVYRSLGREDHAKLMKEAFATVGVADYVLRLKSGKKQDSKQGIEQLKRDFSDYPIEIR